METATLVTSQFLHGSLIHIAGNMLFLWIFGNNVEDRFGRFRFLVFYLVGGIVAGLAQVAIDPTSTDPDDRRLRRHRGDRSARTSSCSRGRGSRRRSSSSSSIQLIDVPAVIVLGFWFVLQLLDGLGSLGADERRDDAAGSRSSPISAGSSSARRRAARPGSAAGSGVGSGAPWDNRAMDDGLVEMVVESVRVHMLSSRHVVILKETGRERYLPIWIGPWEASAIAMRLQGLTPERPLTHDLFASTLEAVDARVARVIISDLAEETFHARLFVERDGHVGEIDARPSDALALAVRVGAPDLRGAVGARPGRVSAPTAVSARRARARASMLEIDRRADRRPAARRLPRVRQLARRRPRQPRTARADARRSGGRAVGRPR